MASAATAECNGVLPVLSWALAFAPRSSNFFAASALAYLLFNCKLLFIVSTHARKLSNLINLSILT